MESIQSIRVSCFGTPPYLMPCFGLPRTVLLDPTKLSTYCRNPGFAVELAIALLNNTSIHFKNFTRIYFQQSNGYGGRLSNNQWTGMIGDVASNQSDVTLPTLTASPSRLEVSDFIDQPSSFMSFCFIVNPLYVAQIRTVSCFDRWSWTALVLVYICMIGALMSKRMFGVQSTRLFSISNSMFNISFRQDKQSCDDISGAMLTIVWSHLVSRMLFVLFASSLYYQTQKSPPVPQDISDIPQFLSRYNLFSLRSGSFFNHIMESDGDTYVRIRKAVRPDNFFPYERKSIQEIISGGKNRMTYNSCPSVKMIASSANGMLVSPIIPPSYPSYMAVNKQLPKHFKQSLAKKNGELREFGIVKKLTNKYLFTYTETRRPLYSFTIGTFSNTFVVYFSLNTICLAMLITEVLSKRCSSRQRNLHSRY